ncbi:radical SAM protein [Streptomyces amritsarensis]|uniref:radical SAM protein n=1 Tax=Streptomyces amritsarensis TaxID=681158 RepID=UPI0036AD9731
MHDPVRIWYVASQRLCNLACDYCVSIGDWAKSRRHDWKKPEDREVYERVVTWIGRRPYPVKVRLGTLGEPFASPLFLERAAWLTRQSGVEHVELVSNAVLLPRRLPRLEAAANLGKLSLWLTWHDGQADLGRFIAAASFAQETFGCFVVVNALLFEDNVDAVARAEEAARAAGLRFNVDLGYDPTAPTDAQDPSHAVPALKAGSALETLARLGGNRALAETALIALTSCQGMPCRAGHDAVFIDIHGQAYRCSNYSAQQRPPLGSVLTDGFELPLRPDPWAPCAAAGGCGNKEDFLNLQIAAPLRPETVPSLGWTDA